MMDVAAFLLLFLITLIIRMMIMMMIVSLIFWKGGEVPGSSEKTKLWKFRNKDGWRFGDDNRVAWEPNSLQPWRWMCSFWWIAGFVQLEGGVAVGGAEGGPGTKAGDTALEAGWTGETDWGVAGEGIVDREEEGKDVSDWWEFFF